MVNQPYNTKENFGCGSGKSCCLPGFYGDNSNSCAACPKDKPSSKFSNPDDKCICNNNTIKSCFQCKSKCAPYNPDTRMYTPISCELGETCKIINHEAKGML